MGMQPGPLHAHPYAHSVPIGKQPWQRHIANIKAAFMAPPIVKQQSKAKAAFVSTLARPLHVGLPK